MRNNGQTSLGSKIWSDTVLHIVTLYKEHQGWQGSFLLMNKKNSINLYTCRCVNSIDI